MYGRDSGISVVVLLALFLVHLSVTLRKVIDEDDIGAFNFSSADRSAERS